MLEIENKLINLLADVDFIDTQLIELEHPQDEQFGDYASNIALKTFSALSDEEKQTLHVNSPRQLAQLIADSLKNKKAGKQFLEQITVAGPGFINFKLSHQYLLDQLHNIVTNERFGYSQVKQGKTWEIEHTSPNPNKAMHLGHLRNNVTGMAVSNLAEAVGVKVIREAVDNNRGIAIARLMWGYLKFARKDKETMTDLNYWYQHQDEWQTPESAGLRPDKFVDGLYVQASQDFKENKKTEARVRQMVVDWENEDEQTWALWEKVMAYSHQGQQLTLQRLDNHWDHVWHEHEHYQQGKDLVDLGLQKGIFRKLEDGAILTDLATYDLPDTILKKSDGTALYITQDLALTKMKQEKYDADKMFWVVGPEQSLALKQMFAVCDQLGVANYDDLVHLDYGYMSIKDQGKMSSRAGNVVYIDDLIDEAKSKVLKKMDRSGLSQSEIEQLAELVAVGAVKYAILKVGRRTDMAFDFETALSLDGNSGPYLQYTHARASSVLAKVNNSSDYELNPDYEYQLESEEVALLRHLYQFPAVVVSALEDFEPSAVATYLHQLAQRFNRFYHQYQIINSNAEAQQLRLAMTKATQTVLANGLRILGIKAPERM